MAPGGAGTLRSVGRSSSKRPRPTSGTRSPGPSCSSNGSRPRSSSIRGRVAPGRFIGTDGEHRLARVDDVDEGRRLAFTWWPDDEGDQPASKVEFVLTPTQGGTRVVVTESPLTARACAATAGTRWAWRLELLVLTLLMLVRA